MARSRHRHLEVIVNIDIGISEKDRAEIAEGLGKMLADSYGLYLKTHNFHWNVTGPMFETLHLMFETQYNELALAVDAVELAADVTATSRCSRPRSRSKEVNVKVGMKGRKHVHGTRRLRRVDRSAGVGPATARRAHVSGASPARAAGIETQSGRRWLDRVEEELTRRNHQSLGDARRA
jgi:ferritin-like protein